MLSDNFLIFIIFFFILFYIYCNYYDIDSEKFVVCETKPDGPYKTHCSLIKYNNNILSAFCRNRNLNDEYTNTKLYMDECPNIDDCHSISVNNDGELIC